MEEDETYKLSNIMQDVIKKSLFTPRQIEIILHHRGMASGTLGITKGAYYRQVGQAREKLASLYYSIIVLQGLGVMLPDEIDVISSISEQISGVKDRDIFDENRIEIMSVIDRMVRQACRL